MKAWLTNQWLKVRTSLWFVPTLMVLAAIALSILTVELDARLEKAVTGPWRALFSGGAAGAESILSTIAGSMITVTGVVFSITIVALSLASGQYGPRLLRNFMRDTGNQVVLGTFIGTFLYCLLGLRAVSPAADDPSVPRVTVVTAIALAVASIAVLIYFIHHVANSIQADTIIARVTKDLEGALDHFYPSDVGEGPALPRTADESDLPPAFDAESTAVRALSSGYVQAVGDDDLMACAAKHEVVVRVKVRPGKPVVASRPVMDVWPADRVTDAVADELRDTVIIGNRRTEEQDPEFPLDQLVEIACRALSPGMNDPFTAVTCVDGLTIALARIGRRRLPSPYRADENGRLRVISEGTSYAGLLDGAFNQIRQYGQASVAVTARLLESLETLASCTSPIEGRYDALREHADRVIKDARDADHDPADLTDLENRYARVLQALADGDGGN